jgi:hypothetical protein
VKQLIKLLGLHPFQLPLQLAAILPIIRLTPALGLTLILAQELPDLRSNLLFTTTHFERPLSLAPGQ